jgi:hypothetical protein
MTSGNQTGIVSAKPKELFTIAFALMFRAILNIVQIVFWIRDFVINGGRNGVGFKCFGKRSFQRRRR